mgnify:CR=1 FL=1
MTDENQFSALVLEEDDDHKVTAGVETLDNDHLPPGDVTVAVEYSTLNYKDAMIIQGIGRLVREYPHVPGIDFAGTVETSDSPDYKPGDKVVLTGWRVGEVHWGGYATRARVKADWLVPLADGLSTEQSMAIGTAGFTAMLAIMALEEHGLTPQSEGEVLVTGASGGVGSAAIQLAAARGALVDALTSPAKFEHLEKLGAQRTFARDADLLNDPGRQSYDVVIDLVGGPGWPVLLEVLKRNGRYAVSGAIGGHGVELDLRTLYLKDLSLFGCTVLGEGVFAGLVELIESGQIRPLVAETFPLERIAQAQDLFQQKGHVGKIVLEVG